MKSLEDLSFSEEYYCDEVRDGFFVSETMKHFWAAQLVVLAEIDKICKRHGINWYADSGTMLGAVRHKGYIPWDDDLDIGMFRYDYELFLKYAREELPDGFKILSSADEDTYNPFGRVVNSGEITLNPEVLNRYHGTPFIVGVDIFPFDKIFEDLSLEEDRMKRGSDCYWALVMSKDEKVSKEEMEEKVKQVEKDNNTVVDRGNLSAALCKLFEKIAQECRDENAQEYAAMYEWIHNARCVFHKSEYDEWREMPFENTLVRVPVGYHDILKLYYGDYMTPVRGDAGHNYPLYRKQEEVFREEHGVYPNRFCFDKKVFVPLKKKKSFVVRLKENLESMKAIHYNAESIALNSGIENAIPFLQTCQNVAVAIGNSIEGKFGSGTETVIALENYCEELYENSLSFGDGSKKELDACIDEVGSKLENLCISSKKEILFLVCKASWWDSIKDVYGEAVEKYSVSVIPIMYGYRDASGQVKKFKKDHEEFEKIPELEGYLTSFDKYNIEKKHPDVIVTQFPYNGCSRSIAIPNLLFTDSLTKYTDELIFVPYLEPDPPSSEDDLAYAAMQELVEQPAVFNSDRILVGSEELRKYYVKKLVDMTDEYYRDYWDNRICLKDLI